MWWEPQWLPTDETKWSNTMANGLWRLPRIFWQLLRPSPLHLPTRPPDLRCLHRLLLHLPPHPLITTCPCRPGLQDGQHWNKPLRPLSSRTDSRKGQSSYCEKYLKVHKRRLCWIVNECSPMSSSGPAKDSARSISTASIFLVLHCLSNR